MEVTKSVRKRTEPTAQKEPAAAAHKHQCRNITGNGVSTIGATERACQPDTSKYRTFHQLEQLIGST